MHQNLGWEKLYTEDGVPFWTNHNERTTSWDPPAMPTPAGSVAVVGVVSEAQGTRSRPDSNSEVFESVDGATEAAAIGVPVGNAQMTQNLGADGRPLPEGERKEVPGFKEKYGTPFSFLAGSAVESWYMGSGSLVRGCPEVGRLREGEEAGGHAWGGGCWSG